MTTHPSLLKFILFIFFYFFIFFFIYLFIYLFFFFFFLFKKIFFFFFIILLIISLTNLLGFFFFFFFFPPLETRKWKKLDGLLGRLPGCRSYHSATIVGNRMIVMGGRSDVESHFGDIHVLDISEYLVLMLLIAPPPLFSRVCVWLQSFTHLMGSYL